MKDLFVLTADSDAQSVMRAVLKRNESLDIRPISFEIDRHPYRDNGVFNNGPELMGLKLKKTDYGHLLLLWDHDGSGCRAEPSQAIQEMEQRLGHVTWKDRSSAVVIVPELEEWLWHNPASIAKQVGCSLAELDRHIQSSRLLGSPKELFEQTLYERQKRKPLQSDFEQIAARASLRQWQRSPSFSAVTSHLRRWFPR